MLNGDDVETGPAGASHDVMRTVAGTIWITGLPAAGKSTLAAGIATRMVRHGRAATVLDGDAIRQGLCADLGFTPSDRRENVRRVGEVSALMAQAGVMTIVALISPDAAARADARATHERAGVPFLEVFIDTPLEVCRTRDPKGLYAAAAEGRLRGLTGVDAAYEPPAAPDVRIPGGSWSIGDSVDEVIAAWRALLDEDDRYTVAVQRSALNS
jgi:adenylyl-sulfate kinase